MSLSPVDSFPGSLLHYDSVQNLRSSSVTLENGGFKGHTSIDLNQQCVLSQQVLETLVEQARAERRDCIIFLAEDTSFFLPDTSPNIWPLASARLYLFDGPYFCDYLKFQKGKIENPNNRELIIDGCFFILYQDQNFDNSRYPFQKLCSLAEYLDKENNPFFEHLIALSDSKLNDKKMLKDSLESYLILELITGTGKLVSNARRALEYAEIMDKEGNAYSTLILSVCYKVGIVKEKNRKIGKAFYRKLMQNDKLDNAQKNFLKVKFKEINHYLFNWSIEQKNRAENITDRTKEPLNDSFVHSHRIFNPYYSKERKD